MTEATAADMSTQRANDAECITQNKCPVCKQVCGIKKPRHALIMHLRRATDLQHSLWKAKHYRDHFRWGKQQKEITVSDIEHLLKEQFGIQTSIQIL